MNRAFLLLGAAVGLTGCVSPEPSTRSETDCCPPTSNGPVSAKSVYEPASLWETDAGKTISLSDLAGRPQVAAMFYSSCHVACPLTLERLKEIESALPAGLRSHVGFVLITFDPDRKS